MRVLLVLAALAAPARADDAGVTIDWARGLVIARGVGLADRHAPSPAVARGTSRRRADDDARARLVRALPALPLAAGGTVGDKLDGKALAALADRAIGLDAQPETDGSWRVELAAPIEAVRQAIAGARTLPAAGDAGPPVIVVEGAGAARSIGWRVGATPVAAIFVRDVPAWATTAPHARGRVAKPGELAIDGPAPTASTLVVVVTPR